MPLIIVNFDPMLEIGPKGGGGHSCETVVYTHVLCTPAQHSHLRDSCVGIYVFHDILVYCFQIWNLFTIPFSPP